MLYFNHDTMASTDRKLMQLRLVQGGAAVDAYWYLIEQMCLDERPLCICNADAKQMQSISNADAMQMQSRCNADADVLRVHCHTLCVDEKTLKKWVDYMVEIGLLHVTEDGCHIYSERAMSNIEEYQVKYEKRRSAAEKRWGNASAYAKHMQSICNADALHGKSKSKSKSKSKEDTPIVPYKEIVKALNEATGASFRPTSRKTQDCIKARFNEGYTLDDFKAVIENKTADWLNDPDMCKFLRPETLFGPKFESYLNAPRKGASNEKTGEYDDCNDFDNVW